MSKAPPIPPEQRAPLGAAKAAIAGGRHDRRDLKDGVQSSEPGDADVNLDTQGRFANTRQNVRPQWKVQDR
ncbi:MAG: hypothetical protein JWO72_2024 [Caulobacteraceae bacterium]|jgi:hypothetical protein|nr:hypothetical protein [Caulobacteraceae bacterium]